MAGSPDPAVAQGLRRTGDRIRHAISFEAIALLIVTPLGAWAFGQPWQAMSVVTVISASIATAWNYGFNLVFDRALLRMRGGTAKTPALRVLHALAFEAGLLLVLVPFIALYLQIGPWPALAMDLSFSGFYLVYTFAFNWAYDTVFPAPALTEQR
ncbi:MAG: PACE efflux transporter [Limimaricola sp.]|uniref:PACE efflux transporter n=1 Tax=Limimaricola sp. TaxID=2211665 RepID=UPI001D24910E|nr:PACE efflux transporter [Limimaricola sp.]MBI1417728.1 PACE efflux transporter [Limimaricola sp.]